MLLIPEPGDTGLGGHQRWKSLCQLLRQKSLRECLERLSLCEERVRFALRGKTGELASLCSFPAKGVDEVRL